MDELRDLYQEVILDHNRKPRNRRALDDATHRAHGHNPLCGDQLVVQLRCAEGKVLEAAFEGDGCAISTASASLMTESVRGKGEAEVRALHEQFHRLVTTGEADLDQLGKLAALAGVAEYPARVKCASLAWHTLLAALDRKVDQAVSTEV
ncbi:MAG: SUF system NifU family Fe-S cluster assembly protein [Candidatus Sericytochromatia bacterium]|nr:SUF system NifU family Fe-S cluster assembly protein [Candidatus Tanganyikabacteria bacterium]